jgi:hypothetical protein
MARKPEIHPSPSALSPDRTAHQNRRSFATPGKHAVYSFHCAVRAVAAGVAPGPELEIGRQRLNSLVVPPEAMAMPLAVTFEEAAERLARLERMFVEPDGSFVWVSAVGPQWQVDGQLHDQGIGLSSVELKGRCPREEFDRLLEALGWPSAPVMFQILPEGNFFGEREFRRVAETRTNAE